MTMEKKDGGSGERLVRIGDYVFETRRDGRDGKEKVHGVNSIGGAVAYEHEAMIELDDLKVQIERKAFYVSGGRICLVQGMKIPVINDGVAARLVQVRGFHFIAFAKNGAGGEESVLAKRSLGSNGNGADIETRIELTVLTSWLGEKIEARGGCIHLPNGMMVQYVS